MDGPRLHASDGAHAGGVGIGTAPGGDVPVDRIRVYGNRLSGFEWQTAFGGGAS